MRKSLVCAVVLVLCALPALAASEARKVGLAGAVSEGKGKTGLTLIGASGEIFDPIAPGQWRRAELGGVSGDVVGGFRDGGRLFAVPRSTPMFEQVSGVWFARPLPNRGPITLARGGAPLVAIGRHVHALSKGGWRRIASVPRQAIALWAKDTKQIVAAVEGNGLFRWSGGRWTQIALTLPAGDGVAALYGVSPTDLLLRTAQGSLFAVGKSGAKALVLPPDLAGFLPDAAVETRQGPRLIGSRAAPEGREGVLVAYDNGALRFVEAVQGIAADDQFSGLYAVAPSGFVATTRKGDVWVRNEQAWSAGVLTATPTSSP